MAWTRLDEDDTIEIERDGQGHPIKATFTIDDVEYEVTEPALLVKAVSAEAAHSGGDPVDVDIVNGVIEDISIP